MWRHIAIYFLIVTKFLCLVKSTENVNKTDKKTFCSPDILQSCQCFYFNSRTDKFLAISVECSAKNFTSISSNISIPDFAEIMDFSSNLIENVQYDSNFTSLTLDSLLLNRNQIRKIEISAFEGLPRLRTLDLSENLLESLELGVFHGINKLDYLNLASNNFKSFIQYNFQYVPILNHLILNHNDLGTFFESSADFFSHTGIGLNPKISRLEMRDINITLFPPKFFYLAYNLRNIDLAENKLISLPELPFTIESLDISNNHMTFLGPNDFLNLVGIKELIANNMQNLSMVQNYTFFQMKNLQFLSMEGCKNLQSFNIYAFGINEDSEYTLRNLSFMGSGLRTLDENLYPLISRLSSLDIRSNPWRCDCQLKWILQLNIDEKHKEFIRCYFPRRLAFTEVWTVDSSQFTCSSNADVFRWAVVNCLIFLCVVLSVFSIWLVFLWPKRKTTERTLDSQTSYCHVDVQPNRAEYL